MGFGEARHVPLTMASVSLENLVKTFLKAGEHYLVVSINVSHYEFIMAFSTVASYQKQKLDLKCSD